MIRDYFRSPRRHGAQPSPESRARYQEPDRQPSRHARDNIDWDSWADPEAPRDARSAGQQQPPGPSRESDPFEEGYGYGNAYFGDDQRLARPRFQQGWEGSYRSTPWTLGAEHISPGLHGPYGRQQQQYELYQDTGTFDEHSPQGRYGDTPLRSHAYRQGRAAQGLHRGIGPSSYVRTDERIREDVCERLTDHPEVDARHLDVAVENGVVLLQGTVSDRVMKYDAEDCSWYVSGVKDVDNRIRVDRAQQP